jgi:uncharacterized protein YcbX
VGFCSAAFSRFDKTARVAFMTSANSIRVVSLHRYPVKGLSPQPLNAVTLAPGETVPGDRIYAIENGHSRFDAERPRHLPKVNFLMLMRNERLAALRTEFDHATHMLTIFRDGKQVARGALNTKLGRQLVEQFFAGYCHDELKGPPRVLSGAGHSFSDVAAKCLHFVNLATVREVGDVAGAPLNPLRFRANVYFDGAEAWAEREWIGKTLRIGAVRLKVFAPTTRCAAINVNPDTAQRDAAIPPKLLTTYGDTHLGFYAEVAEGGEIREGDGIALED